MATLNQVIRERRNVLRQLLSKMKELDGKQEKVQRKIRSLTQLRNRVPETTDLATISQMTSEVDRSLDEFTASIRDASKVFSL